MLKNYCCTFKVSNYNLCDCFAVIDVYALPYFMQVLKSKKPRKFYNRGFWRIHSPRGNYGLVLPDYQSSIEDLEL